MSPTQLAIRVLDLDDMTVVGLDGVVAGDGSDRLSGAVEHALARHVSTIVLDCSLLESLDTEASATLADAARHAHDQHGRPPRALGGRPGRARPHRTQPSSSSATSHSLAERSWFRRRRMCGKRDQERFGDQFRGILIALSAMMFFCTSVAPGADRRVALEA